MYPIQDIAIYLINYTNAQQKPITNIQLNQLLYLIQAAFLTWNRKPCFTHHLHKGYTGPIDADIYSLYRIYGRDPIPKQAPRKILHFSKTTCRIEEINYNINERLQPTEKILIQNIITSHIDHLSSYMTDDLLQSLSIGSLISDTDIWNTYKHQQNMFIHKPKVAR